MNIRPYALLALLALLLVGAARADDAADVQRLMRSGDLDGALLRARSASAARPTDAGLRFLQGVILSDLQRDDEAMAVFQRLTEDFPELAEPYNNIALLDARAGRLDAARAALETALRNDPKQVIARSNLGDIYLRLALQSWQVAATATPGDTQLQRKLQLAREIATGPR